MDINTTDSNLVYYARISVPMGDMVTRVREIEISHDLGSFDSNLVFDIGIRQINRIWHGRPTNTENLMSRSMFGGRHVATLEGEELLAYQTLLGVVLEFIYMLNMTLPTYFNLSKRHVLLKLEHVFQKQIHIGVYSNEESTRK